MFCVIAVDLFISTFRLSLLFPLFNLHARFLIILRGYLLLHDSALFRIFIVFRSDFLGAVIFFDRWRRPRTTLFCAAILIVALFFFTRGIGFKLPWKLRLIFFPDLSIVVNFGVIRYGETISLPAVESITFFLFNLIQIFPDFFVRINLFLTAYFCFRPYRISAFFVEVVLPHKSFVKIRNNCCDVFSSLVGCLILNCFFKRAKRNSWNDIGVIGYILHELVFSVVDQCHAMTW
jgi:hypothetical protein